MALEQGGSIRTAGPSDGGQFPTLREAVSASGCRTIRTRHQALAVREDLSLVLSQVVTLQSL